jgi:hypothetical protein
VLDSLHQKAAKKVIFSRLLKKGRILKFPNPAFGGTEERGVLGCTLQRLASLDRILTALGASLKLMSLSSLFKFYLLI